MYSPTFQFVCLLAVQGLLASAFRSQEEYRNAYLTFQEGFMNPRSVVESGIAPSLADDCVGRVDVTTTFVGVELNIEYVYGLFNNLAAYNTTQLIGVPRSYDIQSVSVEGPIVAASVVLETEYPTIHYTIPIQVDLWLDFNDDLKIQSYDATFRRLPQALKYALPKIGPQIAAELGQKYEVANLQALVATRTIVDICTETTKYCTGEHQQYDSFDACTAFLSTQIPYGEAFEMGENTVICRYIHKNMLNLRPDVHCPHVGPSGGDMCIPRDYVDVVHTFPFKRTFVANNVTCSE